jgi:hypothetical protein
MNEDCKLVTAKPSHEVCLTNQTGEALRHLLQQQVPCGMTMQVIDGFEPIQIKLHHREQLMGLPDAHQALFQDLVQLSAVWKTRQWIMGGQEVSFLLRFDTALHLTPVIGIAP